MQLGIERSFEHDLTVYDAIYVALAEYLDGVLLTTDEGITEKQSKSVHLREFNPDD